VDACVNIADDPFTSDKNVVKFGPVTPEFCWRVCAQDLLHAALWDAFRFNHIHQMTPTVDVRAWSALASLRAGWAHAGLCHASSY